MRVFVAGATGVLGRPLVPRLIAAGHEVTAMTRDERRGERLAAAGARPAICDVYDTASLERAIAEASPEAVIHQLTALPKVIDPRKIDTQLAANDRIRTEGTANLVRAAARAGVCRIVAESLAFAYAPLGDAVKDEEAPLWLDAPPPWRRSVEAIAELERLVGSADGIEGISLRYGNLYGPGTVYAADGAIAEMVRRRQYPIVSGPGAFSFVHVDDAAAATVRALDNGPPGAYNIVDDEPAPLAEWLPAYAEALGAPPPRRMPALLVRLFAGKFGLHLMTQQRGARNDKAKRELDWAPRLPSWRDGFRAALERDENTAA